MMNAGLRFSFIPQNWSTSGLLTRLLLVVTLCLLTISVEAMDRAHIDDLVHQINPARVDTNIIDTNPFTGAPVSDVAREVQKGFWFSFIVFLPFLVLPQILLLVVIFRFRNRGDRKPATFTHNIKIEVMWTAIPVLALLVVAVPISGLLTYQEKPPAALARGNHLPVEVVGFKFAWAYNYPVQNISIGSWPVKELPKAPTETANGRPLTRMTAIQEPAIFVKDRTSTLFLTSRDVNHAWWVPAFGVKKDCFQDRQTNTWFTPLETGFFEGTCAELCGIDHGLMKITAVVLSQDDFKTWASLKPFQDAAIPVIDALRETDPALAVAAVARYIAAGSYQTRVDALRFWMAYDAAIHATLWETASKKRPGHSITGVQEFVQSLQARRDRLDLLINDALKEVAAHSGREGTDA